MKFRRLLRWPLLLFAIYFALGIFWEGTRRFVLGYPPPGSPEETALWIIEKKKDPSVCFKKGALVVPFPTRLFFPFAGMGPSLDSRRKSCVRELAEITHDPSVCELLMPSDYGWSCLGVAEKPNSRQCWFDFGPEPAEVGSGNTYVTLPECKSDPKEMRANRCCEMARILYIENREDCAALLDSDILFDQCQELLARRERNIHACSSIRNEHVRASCEVAVRALKQK